MGGQRDDGRRVRRVEPHAAGREPIDRRRGHRAVAVGAERVRPQRVDRDEQDVLRRIARGRRGLAARRRAQHARRRQNRQLMDTAPHPPHRSSGFGIRDSGFGFVAEAARCVAGAGGTALRALRFPSWASAVAGSTNPKSQIPNPDPNPDAPFSRIWCPTPHHVVRSPAPGRARRRAQRRPISCRRARGRRLARLRHRRDDDDADGARRGVPQAAGALREPGGFVARGARPSRPPALSVRRDLPRTAVQCLERRVGRHADRRGGPCPRARGPLPRSCREPLGSSGHREPVRPARRRPGRRPDVCERAGVARRHARGAQRAALADPVRRACRRDRPSVLDRGRAVRRRRRDAARLLVRGDARAHLDSDRSRAPDRRRSAAGDGAPARRCDAGGSRRAADAGR